MKEFESPTYYLDLDHSLNRATIEGAQPNKKIKVLVKRTDNASALPIAATGELSADRQLFHVVVVTADGEQAHNWSWSTLQAAIEARRGEA